MLTTKEVAERLGLTTTSRVRQLIIKGLLKAEKHGRDWVISEEELTRFKELDRPVGRPKESKNAPN